MKNQLKSKKILVVIISAILILTSNLGVVASGIESPTDFIPLEPITERGISLFSSGVNTITVDKGYGLNNLNSNQRIAFRCTLPESGKYTIVVTNKLQRTEKSSVRARLSTMLGGGGVVNASYNVVDCGASIKFQGIKGQNIDGTISLESGSPGGQIYFMIRRQKAVSYTYYYGMNDIYMHGAADSINTYMKPLGYMTKHYKQKSFINTNENGIFFNNNNEILLFGSHGSPGAIHYIDGDARKRLSVDVFSSLMMNNVKVALWATCHSASSPSGGNSIAYQAYLNGASASVGFPVTIYDLSVSRFSNNFFRYLRDGYNVSEACSKAANQFLTHDSVKEWRVSGNGITTITNPGNRRMTQKQASESKVKEFKQAISVDEYQAVEQTGGVIRYYKTIDGLLTNDFYDIEKNADGSYLAVEKSKVSINKDEANILKNKAKKRLYSSKSSVEDFEEYYKTKNPELTIANVKTEEYIFKIDEELIPFIVYQIELKHEEDFELLDIKCYNLITGEELNYDEISTI